MHPRPSRTKELARRTVIYAIMVFSVIGLLIILMMMVLGYQYDINTRSVERTGLVQYNSFPRPASVSVDGTTVGRTQTKSNVLPGVRQFSISLNGYEPWQKALNIEEGTVTWLNYARLVPVDRVVSSSLSFPSIGAAMASPDSRFMAIWRNDTAGPALGVVDFRSSGSPSVREHVLTMDQIGGLEEEQPAEERDFSIVGWSSNSRYFITRHSYKLSDGTGHVEWLWTDRDSIGSTVNLSKLLGLPIDDVRPMEGRDVFLVTDGDVRQASVSNGSISKPLISNVTSFEVRDDDTITYSAETITDQTLGVWRRSGAEPVSIVSLPLGGDGGKYQILGSRYFGKDTIAVSSGQQVTFYRGDMPTTDDGLAAFLQTATSFTFGRQVERLHFSSNGRFLVAEDDAGYMTFDIERRDISQVIRKYSPSNIAWLDGYHLAQIDESGELIMQEFDGLNSAKLLSVTPGYDCLITQDNKYTYCWHQGEEIIELRRLMMTI